jgi:23S rRNA (adenine2503-C2)-methyltransferase
MWDTIKEIPSTDQNVLKYVFTNDTAVAESVLYKYETYNERTVICCSTQSGCPVGCRFCGAGDAFVRSLSTEEIVAQPVHLLESKGINADKVRRMQIMFMSMGEPLLNLKALVPALRQLYDRYPKAALLISTSAPRVDYTEVNKISVEIPTVGLQFSVHESTDEARNKLIPFKAKLTLDEIAYEGTEWFYSTGRQPFFNYVVHLDNNKDEDVARLAARFDPRIWQATISVICERNEHVAAANARQRELAENFRLRLAHKGFMTRTFDPAGQDDIGGGCGQLWFVQDWMRKNRDLARPSIGAGRESLHTPQVEEPVAV